MLCLEEGGKLFYYGRHDITIFTHLFKHKVNMCTGHISRVPIVSPRHKLHPYRSGACKYRRACLYLTSVNIHHLRVSWQKGRHPSQGGEQLMKGFLKKDSQVGECGEQTHEGPRIIETVNN